MSGVVGVVAVMTCCCWSNVHCIHVYAPVPNIHPLITTLFEQRHGPSGGQSEGRGRRAGRHAEGGGAVDLRAAGSAGGERGAAVCEFVCCREREWCDCHHRRMSSRSLINYQYTTRAGSSSKPPPPPPPPPSITTTPPPLWSASCRRRCVWHAWRARGSGARCSGCGRRCVRVSMCVCVYTCEGALPCL